MAMSIMGLTSVGNDRDMVRSIIPMEICMLDTGKMIRLRALGGITITMDTCTLLSIVVSGEPAATCNLSFYTCFLFGCLSSNFNNTTILLTALRVHSIMAREAVEGSISCLVAESRYIIM